MRKTQAFSLIVILAVVSLTFSFSKNRPAGDDSREEKIFFAGAGIVPHHLLAGELISDFFNRLSVQNPKTIILVGPNHQEKGGIKPLTSLADWETGLGKVEANQNLIQRFVSLGLVEVNERVVSAEHSVSGLVPLIKDFLPKTSVFPLVLSGRMNLEEIETLAKELAKEVDKETVLVASVDFSHGLKSADARQNDWETLEAMTNFDHRKLLSLGNDFLDSPPSIVFLLLVAQKRGWTNFEVLSRTDSAELINDPIAETTSYFLIRYY